MEDEEEQENYLPGAKRSLKSKRKQIGGSDEWHIGGLESQDGRLGVENAKAGLVPSSG